MKEREKQISPAFIRKAKEKFPDLNFTCDRCDEKHTCPCSYDPYNSDGDCLMMK